MEKFSLYDFLGLLLPGVLFVYFGNVLNLLYNFFPFTYTVSAWDISALILLCVALVAGAMLYTVTFWLIKCQWYNGLFGLKKHVADLYLELNVPFQSMNEVLNKKAMEWCGKNIFFSKAELTARNMPLTDEEKNLQDSYYDRMYYELEYVDKIDSAKTLQSFYYFFRQTVTACLMLLVLHFILIVVGLFSGTVMANSEAKLVFWIPVLLLTILVLSVGHARWYRKSMVLKIYWAFFTHLNQTSNK